MLLCLQLKSREVKSHFHEDSMVQTLNQSGSFLSFSFSFSFLFFYFYFLFFIYEVGGNDKTNDHFSLRFNQQIKNWKNENIQIKEDKDEVSKNSERKGKKWKQRQGVKWGGRVGFSIFKLKWNFLEGVLLTNTIACIFIYRSAIFFFFYWIQYVRTNAWCVQLTITNSSKKINLFMACLDRRGRRESGGEVEENNVELAKNKLILC